MTAKFRIGIDISDLIPAGAAVTRDVFPHLAFAVEKITQRAQEIWRGYASGEPMPGGLVIRARSGAYMRSIQVRSTGDFSGEVFSELPYAHTLEDGSGPRDLKTMLNTSLKTRVSARGKRYLIIPFRHGTPGSTSFSGAMTNAVHELWRGLRSSRIRTSREEPNMLGVHNIHTRQPMMVTRRAYRWGDRLTANQLRAAGARGRALRQQTGMVHMRNPTAGGGHGQYLTFRVMSEDSTGWISKGTKAYRPAQHAAERLRPVAEDAFRRAVGEDVKRYLGAGQ